MKEQEKENNTQQPTAIIPGSSLYERKAFIEHMRHTVDNEVDEILKVSRDPIQTEFNVVLAMAAVAACRASVLAERLHEIRRTPRLELMAGTQKEIEQQLFDLVEADEKPAEDGREAGNVTDVTP